MIVNSQVLNGVYSDCGTFTRLANAAVEGTGPHCHGLHSRGSPGVLSQCGIGQGGSMWGRRKEEGGHLMWSLAVQSIGAVH